MMSVVLDTWLFSKISYIIYVKNKVIGVFLSQSVSVTSGILILLSV